MFYNKPAGGGTFDYIQKSHHKQVAFAKYSPSRAHLALLNVILPDEFCNYCLFLGLDQPLICFSSFRA